MKAFFKKLFTKKDWRLVKRIDSPYYVSNPITKQRLKEHCVLTYYLFENQFGDRKFDLADSEQGELNPGDLEDDNFAFRCKDYRETIKPWLAGAYDPEIPNYHSIEHKDLLDTLRGRKGK